MILDVPATGARAGHPCRWQTGQGCVIHADRPDVCAGFFCSWALGDPVLPADARPDRSGVLVWVERGPAGLCVQVRELRPGALTAPWVGRALDVWGPRFAIAVEDALGRRRASFVGLGWLPVGDLDPG